MAMRLAIICPYIPRERCELLKLEKRRLGAVNTVDTVGCGLLRVDTQGLYPFGVLDIA